jgi:hypothetical protein
MAARHKYRLQCQTINKQNKLPCKASGIRMNNGNIRCRIHGGWSRGQTTLEGKVKAYKNLPQFKTATDEEIRTYIRNRKRHNKAINERNTFDANLLEGRFSKLIESLQLYTREQRFRKQDVNSKKDSSSDLS